MWRRATTRKLDLECNERAACGQVARVQMHIYGPTRKGMLQKWTSHRLPRRMNKEGKLLARHMAPAQEGGAQEEGQACFQGWALSFLQPVSVSHTKKARRPKGRHSAGVPGNQCHVLRITYSISHEDRTIRRKGRTAMGTGGPERFIHLLRTPSSNSCEGRRPGRPRS